MNKIKRWKEEFDFLDENDRLIYIIDLAKDNKVNCLKLCSTSPSYCFLGSFIATKNLIILRLTLC